MVKIIKNKKISVLLSAFLSFFIIISLLPSVMGATEYEYPEQIHIGNSALGSPWGEILSGDLNDFTSINEEPVHFTSTPYLFVYIYFPRPSISNGPGELKVVYDYYSPPVMYGLDMTIMYYDDATSDIYTLWSGPWIDPPDYQTETYTTRYGLDVSCVQFVLYGGDLWIDYLGVKYSTGGGGGCPILSVFDGEQYQEEGLLDIHDPDGNDVTYQHTLITSPKATDNRYHLKLTEHPETISDIDQVKFYGILPSNRRIRLPLISAIHCKEGQVRSLLRLSDDKKVEVLGAYYNNGVSQYVDLEFVAPKGLHFTSFVFVIEGNNAFVK